MLTAGAVWDCLNIFFFCLHVISFTPFLWETGRYTPKGFLKIQRIRITITSCSLPFLAYSSEIFGSFGVNIFIIIIYLFFQISL